MITRTKSVRSTPGKKNRKDRSGTMKSDPQKIDALAIRLQDRRIGVVNRLAGDRHLFSFEQEYIDDPRRPTLSLSFKGQTGGLVTFVRAVNLRLPPVFSN